MSLLTTKHLNMVRHRHAVKLAEYKKKQAEKQTKKDKK